MRTLRRLAVRKIFGLLALCPALALIPHGCAHAPPPPPAETALRVMTYNVRQGPARDGVNAWEHRKELCVSRVVAFAPDLLGLQEAYDFQNTFVLQKVPGLAAVGVARDDGRSTGEFSTLMYRFQRFTPLGSGTFWLSETPEVPGSKSWDSAFPRIATWARLHDRQSGRELLVVNTHLDHQGAAARLQGARIIRRFVAERAQGAPVVVLGDLNAAPGSDPVRAFVAPATDGVTLIDAYREIHAQEPAGGTFHAFGARTDAGRIDWIFVSPHFVVRDAAIDRTHEGPVFPSDHYPVSAVLGWR